MQRSDYLKSKLKQFFDENKFIKKALIINAYEGLDILAGALKGLSGYVGPDVDLLCFKARIPASLGEFKDNVKISEDYLSDDDYKNIDNYVFRGISKSWDEDAIKQFKEIFTYRDIRLAGIAEYDLQPYLMARVKALTVISRAVKKENYKAVFILDLNEELGGMDELISSLYSIKAVFFKEERMPEKRVNRKISSFVCNLIDRIAPLFILRTKSPARLIDARLYSQLENEDEDDFILAPFENGLKVRLRCIARNKGYLAFNLDCDKPVNRNSPLRDFDISAIKDKFVFEGINYWSLVKDKVQAIVLNDFRRFRKNIDILTGISKKIDLKLIVLRNDLKELEKAVVLTARKLKIPSLVIQHGIAAEPNCSSMIYADKIAVWGRRDAEWYKDNNNDYAKIAITGNLNSKRISAEAGAHTGKDFLNKLNLTKKKYLVSLMPTGASMLKLSAYTTDDVTENFIRDVITAVKSIGDINLIVKIHPNEKAETYKGLLAGDDFNFMAIVDTVDVYELIRQSDLVITRDSTAGLEAVIMKKPLLVVNTTKRPDLVPYVEKGAALGAYKNTDIRDRIEKALKDDAVRKKMDSARIDFINYFLSNGSVGTRERVMHLIGEYS